jgi:hypothetical protein
MNLKGVPALDPRRGLFDMFFFKLSQVYTLIGIQLAFSE